MGKLLIAFVFIFFLLMTLSFIGFQNFDDLEAQKLERANPEKCADFCSGSTSITETYYDERILCECMREEVLVKRGYVNR